MLTGTFLHLPGIGPVKEKKLWNSGVEDWDGALSHVHTTHNILGDQRTLQLKEHRESLGNGTLPSLASSHQWRALRFGPQGPTGGSRWLALDIETTGLDSRWAQVTVVGLCGHATDFLPVCLSCEDPDWKTKLTAFLDDTDVLLTFNGASFDKPFLDGECGALRWPQYHVDLRFPLKSLGYQGGLKRVQQVLGHIRDSDLQDVDGFMAVRLWREHLRGTSGALETLIRYCLEDTVVLIDLAAFAYDQLKARIDRPWPAVDLTAPSLDSLPYDPGLVRRLSRF
jgi:uncharacterized protein